MTEEEAFNILVNVTGNVAGTRLDHQRIQQALEVIRAALKDHLTVATQIKESAGGTA